MLRLKFMLEYHCSPVWVYDKSELVMNGLPDGLIHNSELYILLGNITREYDSRFIDTPYEFTYKGFDSKEDEAAFDEKLRTAIKMLRAAAGSDYTVEVDDGLAKELY